MHTTTRSAQRRHTCASAVALTLLGLGATLPPAVLAQGRNDTVALSGQAAPGTGGGTFSISLGTPVLNDSGQTAFSSVITGSTSTQGIFRSDSGSALTAIARAGQSAPGSGGGTFGGLGAAVLNASGQMAFFSTISGGTNT